MSNVLTVNCIGHRKAVEHQAVDQTSSRRICSAAELKRLAPMEDFSLWLEFEEYGGGYPAPEDDAECDFCNMQIRLGSALYAANVWTFGYIARARMENDVGEALSSSAAWLVAPDLLVSRLDRPTIFAAVCHLIEHGGLPSNWLVAAGE